MTPFVKKKDIKKDWYIINAQNVAVGRLAAYISKVLRGKNKSTYNPHIDNGDFVVVTNIDKIKFSGKKFKEKMISNEKNHVHNNGIIETMSNQKYNPNSNCDSDFSNLGLSGNTGNETFNTLCQSQNKLIQKNRSLINRML